MKVLVCDDYAPLRTAVSTIMEAAGYTALEARDGAEALQLLEHGDIDVLLLDMHMPGTDGPALLRQIECPPPVVIVVSAFEFVGRSGVEAEFRDKVFRFLAKPVSPQVLLETIESALGEAGLHTSV